MELKQLERQIRFCCRCQICRNVSNKVPGEGSGKSGIIFVGEAPGKQEDLTGKPFVGPAGKILTSLIEDILKLKREDVFITSVLKCRPPQNRDPLPEEIKNCYFFLKKQIDILNPKILISLGRFAASTLIGNQKLISKIRGRLFKNTKIGRPVFVTYHPAIALYNPKLKQILEKDFKKLKQIYEEINACSKTIFRT